MGTVWVAVGLVCAATALIMLHWRGRWPESSIGAAITGATAISASFFIVGSCIDVSVRRPEWFQDPMALWSSIITALALFIIGALIAGPWFVTRMLADAHRDHPAHQTPTQRD
ncbi:hypothetical protein H7I77_09700 [Mycolicibacterium novocastrense]|uniref:Uncharacterized protein n=1 Tax=Mycolicibacterium novocastrense TaxID=59813 RepID=A0AAW5SHJ8_MYCNV|nr:MULTISPECIES: hypothetical protein [Mycolicibacterium]MCV7023620.1 hypothetical protein [Mycolicibacterium novocastrense]MDX1886820.1 hypothetical protein [Mycolicibacterium sp. 120270]GAT07738.1 putative uncharacterized protein [Mycolicibacterium novocastrense]